MKFDLGFGLASVGYLIGIGMLSCTPSSTLPDALEVMFVRIPLYAGLALCLLLSLSGGAWERPAPPRLYWLVGGLGTVFAGAELLYRLKLDSGCNVFEDFVMGLIGVVALLFAHRLLGSERKTART
jgi:hypothetical protein